LIRQNEFELEGYQYDVTAKLLTAQLALVSGEWQRAKRTDVRIPISDELRRLIHETLARVSHALAGTLGAEPIDLADMDPQAYPDV
jgi:hypothetical protein